MHDYRVCEVNGQSVYHPAFRFCKIIHGYRCSFLDRLIEITEKESMQRPIYNFTNTQYMLILIKRKINM